MDKPYAVRYKSPRWGWKEVEARNLDRAIAIAKAASGELIRGEMVSIIHVPSGTVLCYVINRNIA